VVAADCKGVPLVRADLPASAPPPARPRPHHRRGKEEKANKKRMAAVGAVYTIEPFPRTADDVVNEVDRREAARNRPWPRKHQGEVLPAGAVCILDLFHVLEYLWKAAWCFFDEASEKERAEEWVEAKLRALLKGRVASVIRGLRVLATRRGLRGQARKTVEQVTGYLERNRERMK
jgi:hypothetical protein